MELEQSSQFKLFIIAFELSIKTSLNRAANKKQAVQHKTFNYIHLPRSRLTFASDRCKFNKPRGVQTYTPTPFHLHVQRKSNNCGVIQNVWLLHFSIELKGEVIIEKG